MTLTEQWKKGELPAGYYYVKNEFGNIFPTEYSEEYDYISDVVIKDFWTEVSDIVEIIDKVPTYDDYMAMKDCVKAEFEAVTKMTQAKIDCEALAKLVLKLSPERKEWLEKHYGEYL